jgi:hypothetical protein
MPGWACIHLPDWHHGVLSLVAPTQGHDAWGMTIAAGSRQHLPGSLLVRRDPGLGNPSTLRRLSDIALVSEFGVGLIVPWG